MQKLDAKTDGATVNIVEENIERLRDLFPDAFTESSVEGEPRFKVDFEALRGILGGYTEDSQERYRFTWNGKARARRIAQTPSTGTLRPCPDESVNWDSTQNLFIEGDNLEVLKLLQKSYHKRIKLIYIDPPYNTGNEFIYPDKFADNLDTYLRYTGQVDEEGLKLSANAETSGRYHTNWLNMMLPRLILARNLLRDDGVMFISIDDHEVSNLRSLCDEVFGEENFVGTFVWQSKKGGGSDNRSVVVDSEFVLCYARAHGGAGLSKVMMEAEPLDQVDDKGPYRRGRELNKWGSNSRRQDRPTMHFAIPGPSGENVFPIRNDGSEGCWRWGRPKMADIVARGDVEFVPRDDDTFIVYEKVRSDAPRSKPYRTWLKDVGTTADGSTLVRSLFDDKKVFDFPKPVGLVRHLCEIGTTENGDLVLDFFAGSATTAQAVLEKNQQDGITLRFIMIQLPERVEDDTEAAKAGYATIAHIGKERIRRVIQSLASERVDKEKTAQDKLPGTTEDLPETDLGLKVFKLDASNIKPWDVDFDNLDQALLNSVENIKPDRSETDVLYELLLKFGLDLAVPIEERTIAGKTVFIIGAGALVVCLASDVTIEAVEGVAKLKEELKPEIMRVVFKDAGFKDDVVKTNAVQILRQAGIEDVKSL